MKVKLNGRIDLAFDDFGELRKAQLVVDQKEIKSAIPMFDNGEEVIVEISSKKEDK